MLANNDHFYGNLLVNNMLLGELFIKEELFMDVPDDWHVVITDIKNSTLAVLEGGSQNVNLIATGSIISVLNIALKAHITVPFFFWRRWRNIPGAFLNYQRRDECLAFVQG
jgi:hypothetical protein